jgi:hypothetical protein
VADAQRCVEIVVATPDGVMFSTLYTNTDDRLGTVFDSLVVGSIVNFDLSGSENSCSSSPPSPILK